MCSCVRRKLLFAVKSLSDLFVKQVISTSIDELVKIRSYRCKGYTDLSVLSESILHWLELNSVLE